MKTQYTLMGTILTVVVCLFMGIRSASAQTTSTDSVKKEWTYAVTPYFWFADIGATLEYGPAGGSQQTDVNVGAEDYLSHLKMALLLGLEARFNKWAVLSDVVYMRLGDEKSKVKSVEFNSDGRVPVSGSANAGTNTTIELTGWTLLGGYRLYESEKGSFEPTFGLRYFGTKADTDWNLTGAVDGPGSESFQQSGSMKASGELWDALVGFRGNIGLGHSKLFIPYYFDIGAGDSDLTFQWSTGLSYAFHWGEISATYRELQYQTNGSDLLKDLSFRGPSLGVSFQF